MWETMQYVRERHMRILSVIRGIDSKHDCAGARSSERDSLVVHYKEEDCRPALDLVNQLEQETLHLPRGLASPSRVVCPRRTVISTGHIILSDVGSMRDVRAVD